MAHDLASVETRLHRHLDEIKGASVGAHRVLSALNGNERRRPSPRDTLIKSLAARIVAYPLKADPAVIARQLYNERIAKAVSEPEQIFKAVTNPAQTTVPGWAQELAEATNIAPLPTLSPQSTYAQLYRRGLRLEFSGAATAFKLPARTDPGDEVAGGFVGEGEAIPVKKISLTSGTILPHKIGVISTFTAEIARRSLPNIEALLRDAIAFDTALTLDGILLSDDPATASSPAGILAGVVPIAPTAGGGIEALSGDLSKLAEAIPYANDLIYLMALAEAQRAAILAPALAGSFVVAPALSAKQVVAIDASDFSSCEGLPVFDVSSEAAIHEETEPLPLSAGAEPATPQRSLYQTDVLGLRMLADVTWTMRRSGRVQTIVGVTW